MINIQDKAQCTSCCASEVGRLSGGFSSIQKPESGQTQQVGLTGSQERRSKVQRTQHVNCAHLHARTVKSSLAVALLLSQEKEQLPGCPGFLFVCEIGRQMSLLPLGFSVPW